MSSQTARYRTLLGFAVALIIGCGSPPADSPPEPPPAAASPKIAESPAPALTDPVAAARLERVRESLEQGLDVDKADRDGRTALMMAAFEGYTEVVGLLLDHGAGVDRIDREGRTAMMYASSGPFPQTVELLLESGANVDHVDTTEGWTGLMFAAAEGHRPVVETLLRHGADIGITDGDGGAAIDHARERGQTAIVTLLESRSGNP